MTESKKRVEKRALIEADLIRGVWTVERIADERDTTDEYVRRVAAELGWTDGQV